MIRQCKSRFRSSPRLRLICSLNVSRSPASCRSSQPAFIWGGIRLVHRRFRLQAQIFWEMVAFLLNGFIFIMIGLQLPGILHNLSQEPLFRLTTYGFLVSATVVLVRIAWVFPATYLPRWLSPNCGRTILFHPGSTSFLLPGPGCVASFVGRRLRSPHCPGQSAAISRPQLHSVSDLLRHPNDACLSGTDSSRPDYQTRRQRRRGDRRKSVTRACEQTRRRSISSSRKRSRKISPRK